MSEYQSKPSIIEAVQWTGSKESLAAVIEFCGDKCRQSGYDGDRSEDMSAIKVELLAGKDGAQEWVPVPLGHWLVNQPGDKSDIWPVDPDYFANKYVEKGDGYNLADFRAAGLLWLVNASVFHPRGFAMAINDEANTWVLMGDGTEPWSFVTRGFGNLAIEQWGADPHKMPEALVDDDAAFANVEAFFGIHRPVTEEPSPTKG